MSMEYHNGYPLTFSIPVDIRDLDLIFWMRPFTIDTLQTRYRMNYPYSALYLQKNIPYANRKAMDPAAVKALSFQITSHILPDVQNIFKMAEDWFTDESIKELYGVNDEGTLIFNMDYKDLSATCANEYGNARTAIQLVPAPIEIGQGVIEPGVILYINKKENAIILRKYQLLRLANFFKHFSFIAYTQFAMSCFQYCLTTNSILTYEQVRRRMEQQPQFNSNFQVY